MGKDSRHLARGYWGKQNCYAQRSEKHITHQHYHRRHKGRDEGEDPSKTRRSFLKVAINGRAC